MRDGPTETVTREGVRFIDDWRHAETRVQRARSDVTSAEVDLTNATDALARWLLPEDAKMGEKIAVWHEDSLIQAEVTSIHPMQAKITVRKRGRSMLRP